MDQDSQLISSISASKLTVQQIFSDNYLFTIPNYQRPYSWEEEHSLQLLDDLHSFAFKEDDFDSLPPYFLGSAVIIKKEHVRDAQIVDGQQRLTTLTILLSCLRYAIDDPAHKSTISEFIFQSGNKLKGTSATYRLKSRPKDQDYFNRLIQDPEGLSTYYSKPAKYVPQNEAQEQMLSNAKAFIEQFRLKKYQQFDLERLITYIIQKLVIVVVASTDEDMAFRIFNVLNDRGKDLTIADILKSEILEKIPQAKQTAYTEKWENCEIHLGAHRFTDFFGHLRAIYAKKKASKAIIAEIREYAEPTKSPEDFIDNILIPFSNSFSNILKKDFSSPLLAEEINQQLRRLSRVSHTDWIPSAIHYMAGHSQMPDYLYAFLQQLEKVTIAMEAMKSSLNERLERYGAINTIIADGADLYHNDSPFMLSSYDRENIITTLQSPDLYGKRLVKPVLAKIEEQMNDSSISINYTALNIEHILPQNPSNEYWQLRFDIEQRIKYTNSLGNLSLITVRKNSQAKNYEYPRKIDTYFRADGTASNLAMVNVLMNEDDWSPIHIQKRSKILINHFLKAMKLAEM